MPIEFDLKHAHAEYAPLIELRMTTLARKYPRASLKRVYVGKPRRDGDISMGYYDEKQAYVWLNGYWFSKPIEFLDKAAKSEPLFHGPMVEEPAHVVTHEFGHALDWGLGKSIKPRMNEVWVAATKDPSIAPAAYSITNDAEYLAELFACCELELATPEQQEQLRYILEG